ncbi:MAG: hypothetical protein U9Q92_04055 [archaeon]|nr:hypothetical protein [archaeon]
MMKNTLTQALTTFAISAILTILVLATFAYSSETTLTLDIDKLEESYYTTITMHGQLASNGIPIEGAKIGVMADDSTGTHVFADELVTSASGYYTTYFKLENTRVGSYIVYVSASTTQAGSVTSTKYFSIGDCTEDWTCGSWSFCNADSQQTRTCTDNNMCGTEDDKPGETRGCTPSCSTLGGQICSSSQTCDGTYVDSSDSSYCCDGTCRSSSGSTGSSSGSDTGTLPSSTEENETATEPTEEEEAPVDDTIIADEDINETGNTTAAIDTKANETAATADDQKTGQAPTGGLVSVISKSRWLIVNAILIVLIIFFGRKLASKGAKEDEAPGRYSFRPKSGKSGFTRYLSNMAGIISFSNAAFGHSGNERYNGEQPNVARLKVVVSDDD